MAGASPPRERRIASDGGDLCLFEWGECGTGPSLLMLHATGFHARLWDRVVAALPQPMHVIAADLPGHGRSFRPADLTDWGRTARSLLPLVDTIAAPLFHVAGHSMGGWCAAYLAAHRPGRVASATLIDPVIMNAAFYGQAGGTARDDWRDHPVARRRNQWDSWQAMADRFGERPPYAGWQRAVLDDYCRYGLVAGPEGLELACPPLLESSCYAGSMATDPWVWLGDIACPALVIRAPGGERDHGMDFSKSPTDPGLASSIPHARDDLWDDCSHFIPMEQPVRTAEAIAAMVAATTG